MFKKTLITLAVTAALPSLAMAEIDYKPTGHHVEAHKQDPSLDWNDHLGDKAQSKSLILQDGTGNLAKVEQEANTKKGRAAKSLIVQYKEYNKATVSQDASRVDSTVYQIGLANRADVEMGDGGHDYSKSVVEQFGFANEAEVTSYGSGNDIYVLQYIGGNDASVEVGGDHNSVDSRQGLLGGHETEISVWGDGNVVDNDQGGLFQSSTVGIEGDDNTVVTNQWGFANTADVELIGDRNGVHVFQDAAHSISKVSVYHGDGNAILTYQYSDGSKIDVELSESDYNDIIASQGHGGLSQDDTIEIGLYGSDDNVVRAFQGDRGASSGNTIKMNLSHSDGNFIAVAQNGAEHFAKVDANGAEHSVVKIDQKGFGNKAVQTIH